MNDDELKRRLAKLRVPNAHPDEQESALDSALRALRETTVVAESHWTWREWLWPSPLAWGALATIWLGILAQHTAESPAKTAPLAGSLPAGETPRNLFLARHDMQELLRQFQEPPRQP